MANARWSAEPIVPTRRCSLYTRLDTVQRVMIRDAHDADMAAVRDLYNALIPSTTVAWTESLQTLRSRRAWFRRQQAAGNPVLVAENDGEVVGFTSYESFRGAGKWPGYRHTVEHTIHVGEAAWGAGTGRALLEALLARAAAADMHAMVGAIDADNIGSIRFHERLGFTVVATMPEVGRKFDRWLDLVLVQRIVDPPT
jgi:phosphinothricin acetyltransferase